MSSFASLLWLLHYPSSPRPLTQSPRPRFANSRNSAPNMKPPRSLVLEFAENAGDDQRERINRLRVEHKELLPETSVEREIENIARSTDQSKYDASIDSISETHKRMQAILFIGEDGKVSNLAQHLRGMVSSRFFGYPRRVLLPSGRPCRTIEMLSKPKKPTRSVHKRTGVSQCGSGKAVRGVDVCAR